MKQHATKRVDLSGSLKQVDIRGTVGVDVLVGADGSVVCARGVCGPPILLSAVVEAVRRCRFKPLNENNVSVVTSGSLILPYVTSAKASQGLGVALVISAECSKEGSSMT